MSSHTVSAIKYRPDTFENVVGQSHITSTLRNAIKQNQLAHSFLFTGPRGVGKTTCARILAKTINCEQITSEGEACNQCESCRIFNENKSMNIYELDAASNNSVDDIRNLVEQVRFGPQGGSYKVYIIDEVHMLSQSAFNAFLKTLEEPPDYAIFILATTEKHRILPTILSRCQIFDFNRIQISDIRGSLEQIASREKVEAEPEALQIIAQKADGALRDAMSLYDRVISFTGSNLTYQAVIDNLNILDYDYFFKAADYLINKDLPQTLLIFNEVLNQGFDGHNYLVGLSEHLRNLLVCKDEKTLSLLEITEQLQGRYQEQARQVSTAFLLSALNILNYYDLHYKGSKNQRLHTEIALMKLAHLQDAISLPEIQQNQVADQQHTEGKAKDGADSANSEPETPKKKVTTKEGSSEQSDAQSRQEEPSKVNGSGSDKELQAETKNPSANGTSSGNGDTGDAVKEASPRLTSLSAIHSRFKQNSSRPEAAERQDSQTNVATQLSDIPVTQEQVDQLWQKFLEEALQNQLFLYNNLVDKDVTLQEDRRVTFSVESKAVKQQFEQQKTTLIDYMQAFFGGTPVSFEPIVEQASDQKKRSYLVNSKDKFEAMVEKNPKLKKIQDQLGLRLDQ